ncbi:hybrid sensor histidine kinase/response regulator [Comamonas sp. JC664]|uniref:hybrid sensor histidine kinase/response regulator n=1 Tax=Comamonas sp. JC664 TaxID=2801917 RepID=UPI00174EBB96|nr:hybrid sensor histidine kinase/response regulator [Comamonas sp. JC664]MBL0693665.1 response regulator [Comamonas sp. JC664]GHG73748.1 hypothetical protein GCM10012319_20890 [Comamonas sp. KCTC 72670]
MEEEGARRQPPGTVSESRTLRERLGASLAKLERLCAGEDVPQAVRAELASLQALRGELETLLGQAPQVEHRAVSLGHLAAGLAHEINNPLAAATGNLEYLRQRLSCHPLPAPLADECQQVLDETLEGARHIHRVVTDLRALSTGDACVEHPVDLQAVLERTLRIAASQLRHRARVARAYAPNVPRVLGTETKLGQVALNLVLNAVQALPEAPASEHQVTLSLREEARGVVLSIADTGRGIPAEVLPHIFDPFFTTRNEGMGMGMAICRDIVTAMGGAIRVHSTEGQGTTVEVTLRRAQAAEAPRPARPSPRRRILVVDEEPRVVDLLRRLMQGHELVTAAHGDEALEVLRASADVDIILCDLMMPGLSGIQFYEQVRKTWPGLQERIVFTSGGAFTVEMQRFLQQVKNPLLTKPLERQRLQGVLASTGEPLEN